MSIHNLDKMFKPESIALIGASRRPGSVGAVVARNLFNAGFQGPIMPVNPNSTAIEGVLAYPDTSSLPLTPDLAVIATPPQTVPGLVDELCARGTRAVVVITAGFGEGGDSEGEKLLQQTLDAARPHMGRIIGPNCLGIMVPGVGLNAGFAHINPNPGDIAFVAQSGAVVTSVLDWAYPRGIGFSHFVSLGDQADVDFGDMLDYLAADPGTRAILLYIEAVKNARKFMSAARAAARAKPVIVIKAGRNEAAAAAAASHTGALAGMDAVYDAAFRRAGMLRVTDLGEVFSAVETLALAKPVVGERLAILTNGGGIGVLATDDLMDRGGRLADLTPETIERLNGVLPRTWSHGNPVDIIGDAPGQRYADSLSVLLTDPGVDGVLVLNCPTAVASSQENAEAVIRTIRNTTKPVLTCWLGHFAASKARKLFAEARVPSYNTPTEAVEAFMHMVSYRRNQELLMETPTSSPQEFIPDGPAVRAIVDAALAEGRAWLTEPEAKSVLAAYGLPVVQTRTVGLEIEEVLQAASEIGYPVAIKILSPDITHKSDVGGVALDLEDPDQLEHAARFMLENVKRAAPKADLDGFTVQQMVETDKSFELIVGMIEDPEFGPVMLFGHGGTAVEVIGDRALALPPLNLNLAHEAMTRTRIYRQLLGYRDVAPTDLDAVALTLVKTSQLVSDFPEIAELDINPLLANAHGCLALDARVKLQKIAEGTHPAQRLSIQPYPKELEDIVTLRDGSEMFVRPVRPEDEPALHDLVDRSSPDDIRLRFFAPLKRLSHSLAARLTQIDYEREMSMVAQPVDADHQDAIYGIVRIAGDPNLERAEYAVMVRSDQKGRGIGYMLMSQIIDYARRKGYHEIFGDVLAENTTMLKMCHELRFTITPVPDDLKLRRVHLRLDDRAAA